MHFKYPTDLETEMWMSLRLAICCLTLMSVTAGCSTKATRELDAERIKAHNSPLELRGEEGVPIAHIAIDGGVTIGTKDVELRTDQRVATLRYRVAALNLVDHSMREASQFTRTAMPRVLFGMVFRGVDRTTKKLEADANRIPHSPRFCTLLDEMRASQDVMVSKVDELRRYARLTRQDVDDCKSGHPYRQSL